VPASYDRTKPAPLLIAFHGYGDGDDSTTFEGWFQLASTADARGFLYALPNGTFDASHQRFWNATDACCNFGDKKVDDVAYVAAVIDEVARTHALDRNRVFLIGVSAGGVMVHRLACDLSDRVAAIVSVSGTTWADATKCAPTAPVAIVEFHGTNDKVVPYDGGSMRLAGPDVPGARETVEHWSRYDQCKTELAERAPRLDLESTVVGTETRVEAFGGCAADVELWTAEGGPHAPRFTRAFAPALFDFFSTHPKAR
jgi:polyhydroxybutyrate depolymerase